jgi:hypothetical protein
MALFDSAGTLLASNSSAPSFYGAGGSTSNRDPFISYQFTVPGTYVVGVAREGGANPSNGSIGGRAIPSGTTYTLHASVEGHDAITTLEDGGDTFYFGNSDPSEPENYNVPGTTPAGDLISNAFSLKNYSAADKPVLYFNYRLETEFGDYFRVYIQRPDGTEELMATSNAGEVVSGVVRLYSDDTWRQSRIELDQFAGLDGIRIRYNFTSNGPSDARGVHIDDVIIGFAERGEMITQAGNLTDFVTNPGSTGITSGAYQLEIRQSTPYGRSLSVGRTLVLEQAFDTNDRFTQQTTLVVPAGRDLQDGDTFRIGDGASVATFEFDSNGIIQPGNVRIQFSPTDADYVIALRIRDAINSSAVQSLLRLQAAMSDGAGTASRSNLVNLFGASSGDILPVVIEPLVVSGTVEDLGTFDDGSSLRAAILGSGVAAVGQANLIGGTDSAGFFTGGLGSIGIASGIVLSTGDVAAAAGPNLDDRSSGLASGSGDADLDAALGITTTDATSLEFQFSLAAAGTLFFDYVFASEEYNENVLPPDGFAILVKPQGSSAWTNYALVPGTGQPVSTATVNRTTNAGYFRNNDPSDAGRYLRYFGYDGFTDVFQVAIPLAAGIHAIKFVVGDVGDPGRGQRRFDLRGQFFDAAVGPAGGHPRHFARRVRRPEPFPRPRSDARSFEHDQPRQEFRDRRRCGRAGYRARRGHSPGTDPSGASAESEGVEQPDDGGHVGRFCARTRDHEQHDLRRRLGRHSCQRRSGAVGDRSLPRKRDLRRRLVHRHGLRNAGDVRIRGSVASCSNHDTERTAGLPGESGGGDGWTNGRVPINYDMVALCRSAGNAPVADCRTHGRGDQRQRAGNQRDDDGGEAVTAPARSVASIPPNNFGDVGVYVYHARQVVSGVRGGQVSGSDTAFQDHHLAAIAHGPQPFTRVINNTIYGTDGSYSSYPDNPANEPNDTIFNAVDTRQGRQASPETYTRTNVVLGNTTALPTMPSADVDMYKFQMDIFDHALITIDGNGFAPEVRLFNARGEELLHDGSVFPPGIRRPTWRERPANTARR